MKSADKLLVVDAISSIGSIPLDTDALDCDIVISGSKAWMIPPGLVFVAVSPRALGWPMPACGLPRFYWDFTQARASADKQMTPWTPARSACSLHCRHRCGCCKPRVSRPLIARHARLGDFVRGRLEQLGLPLLVKDRRRVSNTVTAFWVPALRRESGPTALARRVRGASRLRSRRAGLVASCDSVISATSRKLTWPRLLTRYRPF